ncbi:unnamed protein product [Dovyalis caffra]|uniref:Uncharacterized protein n=1 Tax=Dovyalis caffra TaxID=77055 RepID=A0AAV1SLK7_9ROSI|nr:unnamed protein product [Dovyalis caffra]
MNSIEVADFPLTGRMVVRWRIGPFREWAEYMEERKRQPLYWKEAVWAFGWKMSAGHSIRMIVLGIKKARDKEEEPILRIRKGVTITDCNLQVISLARLLQAKDLKFEETRCNVPESVLRSKLALRSASEKESPYGAAMSGDWKRMIKHYMSNASDLLVPITYGNTVLHEATIYRNFEAVKLSVQRCPDLVSIRNDSGETPLFKAAEFAEAEMVKFLLQLPTKNMVDDDGCIESIHRQRSSDHLSNILSAAILGQRYETALMLLELDESLHSLKDKHGITALQLLALTPSAFKSGYPMTIHERLHYCCAYTPTARLPVTRRHKVNKLQEETSGLGDLESGLGRKVLITERDQLAMDSKSKRNSPYGAATSGDWESMIEHYESNAPDLLAPFTFSRDTALHIAVCSKKEQPLKALLHILCTTTAITIARQKDLLRSQNSHGNTVLHHATIYGNFEAVKLLVESYPDLVSITNNSGETPLFTAAEFADADIVRLLLESLSGQTVDHRLRCLPSIHRQRSVDRLSILSAAILGQHFETALVLLKVDKSLHILEDDKGITALQLLAHIPSAFKSLPVTIRLKVKKLQEEALGHARQAEPTDLESGLGRNRRGGPLNYLNVRIKGIKPWFFWCIIKLYRGQINSS